MLLFVDGRRRWRCARRPRAQRRDVRLVVVGRTGAARVVVQDELALFAALETGIDGLYFRQQRRVDRAFVLEIDRPFHRGKIAILDRRPADHEAGLGIGIDDRVPDAVFILSGGWRDPPSNHPAASRRVCRRRRRRRAAAVLAAIQRWAAAISSGVGAVNACNGTATLPSANERTFASSIAGRRRNRAVVMVLLYCETFNTIPSGMSTNMIVTMKSTKAMRPPTVPMTSAWTQPASKTNLYAKASAPIPKMPLFRGMETKT